MYPMIAGSPDVFMQSSISFDLQVALVALVALDGQVALDSMAPQEELDCQEALEEMD